MKTSTKILGLASLVALTMAAACGSDSSDTSTPGGTAGTAGSSGSGTAGNSGNSGTAGSSAGTSGGGTGGGTAGNSGTSGGGTGGGTAGNAGSSGNSGTSGGGTGGGTSGTGGQAGEAGATSTAGVCTGKGCLMISGTIAAMGDQAGVQAYFAGIDLTGAVITISACVEGGVAGVGVQSYVQSQIAVDGGNAYPGDFGNALYMNSDTLSCATGFHTLMYTVQAVTGDTQVPPFDPAMINSLTIKLNGGATGPYATGVMSLFVDSITVTGDKFGPYNFATNITGVNNALSGSVADAMYLWVN